MTSTTSQAPRLAVVDSDGAFLHALGKTIERGTWQLRVLAHPPAPDELIAMRLSALVLDPAVAGTQAWTYLEQVCTRLPDLGVVVCTGPSTVAQRVKGIRMGADDWISKPCHPAELLARVEAVVRGRRGTDPGAQVEPVRIGEVEVRADRFEAYVGDEPVGLTRREFELVQLFAATEGQVLPREEIYQRVWGYAMARGDRSVDVFVRKLRQKLERASPGWRYIHTHFGIGYRFAAEPADADAAAAELAVTRPPRRGSHREPVHV
jgi:DNA-binding response OmpR family regulator